MSRAEGEAPSLASAPVRMMTRAEFRDGTGCVQEQEERCVAGDCALTEVHHPKCARVSPPATYSGCVQIRCGCMATNHCRNTGLLCGGNPCYIVLDEIALVDLTAQIVRTRFQVTRTEEQRAKRAQETGNEG